MSIIPVLAFSVVVGVAFGFGLLIGASFYFQCDRWIELAVARFLKRKG
jgi:hypothetical protein